MEEVNRELEILELEIKMAKLNLEMLEFKKPFWFQRKKIKLYFLNKDKLEKRVLDLENKFSSKLEKLFNSENK